MGTSPEDIVRAAEAAYASRDLDQIMALFDPEIVLVWNGRVIARGHDELRRWHEERLVGLEEFSIQKMLRAASGDTIAVEWISRRVDPTSRTRTETHGGEFWTMREERLLDWHAYAQSYSVPLEAASDRA